MPQHIFHHLAYAVLILSPFPAFALELTFPLDCQYQKDCFIQNYVDTEPNDEIRDYRCGKQSYQGHSGTDFRLIDIKHMQQGVAVRAAASGTVEHIRDGEEDILLRNAAKDPKKGCGNAISIDHGGGFQTQYCHLKKHSILVEKGDKVQQGEHIAQIGLSGNTDYPHLHLMVLKDKKIIDPFIGIMDQPSCIAKKQPIWDQETQALLDYNNATLLALAFANQIPTNEAILENSEELIKLHKNAPILTLWSNFIHLKKNDQIALTITNKQGHILAQKTKKMPKNRAQQFVYIGKKNNTTWQDLPYQGHVTLERDKEVVIEASTLIH